MADELTAGTALEKDERDTPEFWRRWIKAAEKASEDHWKDAQKAWREYEYGNASDEDCRPAQIYWSSCKTLEPAYYSRTPKITTRRKFDTKDEIALTGALVAQRLGESLVQQCEFDAVMAAVVGDYIHADKATAQLVYEAETEPERIALEAAPDGSYVDQFGQPWADEVLQDDIGFFGKGQGITKEQRIYPAPCQYDEVLHTPDAKSHSEITEQAYYFYLSRSDAEKRFADKAKGINWKSKKDAKDRSRDDSEYARDKTEAVGEYVEGWECWSKPNKRVYWVSKQFSEGFLDSKDDPYHLEGFFPSAPFIIGSKPAKSLYPVPAYIRLQATIDQLHECADKVEDLTVGIERKCLVSGADESMLALLNARGHGTFVAAPNLAAVLEKGGLEGMMFWLPVQELVNALNELTGLQAQFKNDFYEAFGVPDILRGATEPLESATAQQLKTESAHDRFKLDKKRIAGLARDLIEMMVDLALGVYADEKIMELVGFKWLSPADQQRFPAALAMLRDDKARTIRIEIDSDTMSFVDEQLKAQQASEAATVVTEGLKNVAAMIQQSPEAAAIGLQTLLLSLDSMPGAREMRDDVKDALNKMIEAAKNPPPPAPPPPDYEKMKLDIASAKQQADAQAQQGELSLKQMEMQAKQAQDSYAMQLEQQKLGIEQYKLQLEQQIQQFMIQLEQQRVQIEQFKAEQIARESEMEEIRLAREADIEQYKAAVDAARSNAPAESTPPVINVIQAAQPQMIPVPQPVPVPEPQIVPVISGL